MSSAIELKTAPEILEFLDSADSLHTVPIVLNKTIQALSNPEADLQEIADLVMKDPILTAKILRLVNSPFIGLPREITSLKQAIVFLGLKRIRDIVLTTATMENFPLSSSTISINKFWAHALGCAKGASLLNVEKKFPDSDTFFIAGLLHDIGEVAFAQFFPNEFSFVYEEAKIIGGSLYKVEKDLIGITHCDIGAKLAESWNFPPYVIDAIQYHHSPELAEENEFLVAVINLADVFARLLGLNYGINEQFVLSIQKEYSFQVLLKHFDYFADSNPSISAYDNEFPSKSLHISFIKPHIRS